MEIFKKLLISVLSIPLVVSALMLMMSAPEQAKATRYFDKYSKGKCDVPPTWTGPIRGKKRWVPTFINKRGKPHAFCDRQTGLVWEAEPSDDEFVWGVGEEIDDTSSAQRHCINRIVEGEDGQKGWRLPYAPELASLIDTSSSTCGPPVAFCLPDGNPFRNVQPGDYWLASEVAGRPSDAWFVTIGGGGVFDFTKKATFLAWCVRGAMSTDGY